jgi:hypothetical protein
MSTGIPQAAVRNTWAWAVVMALLPAMARAGAPSAPPDPNANSKPAVKADAAQPSKQPQSKPVLRPGVRTPASFTREMPLSEAIDILRNCTDPPLPIVVLWRDLDSAGIYQNTPIGIDGIPGIRLRQYLDLLAASLSAGAPAEVGYVVHHGVITIATTTALPASKQITRVYDVSDLTAPPSNPFMPMGYGGLYGGQMTGPAGGYGSGLGMGNGRGSSYMPGGYNGAGGLPGLLGGTRTAPGVYRRR